MTLTEYEVVTTPNGKYVHARNVLREGWQEMGAFPLGPMCEVWMPDRVETLIPTAKPVNCPRCLNLLAGRHG